MQGLSVDVSGLRRLPLREIVKVGESLHEGNPTLSAEEIEVQWHGEPLRLETSLLQWMHDQNSLRVLLYSQRSTTLAVIAVLAVGPAVGLFCLVHLNQSSHAWVDIPYKIYWRVRDPTNYPPPGSACLPKRLPGCGRCTCYIIITR